MPIQVKEPKPNPYDELPYLAFPIEWTAPEHLALASLLHGGPRVSLKNYRVLELGCAGGANLLPLAWYRQQGDFTGVDASARQIDIANQSKQQLGVSNLNFIQADFRSAASQLEGSFDIIMAHGVFSWVTEGVRNAMLELCQSVLAPGGLLYLNYNTHPGWTVRGMVRDFLMKQTAGIISLKERAELCREISAKVIAPLKNGEHAYTELMAKEFQMVVNNHPAYIAHEYLSPENNAYWRSEFFAILNSFGFDYVADADFNCISNRITTDFSQLLSREDLAGGVAEDSADLMCYRQMQSPILTQAPCARNDCSNDEFGNLFIASRLELVETKQGNNATFCHPDGPEIETSDVTIHSALIELQPLWPRGRRINELFPDIVEFRESLEHLLKNDLVELRCIEPGDSAANPRILNEFELSKRNFTTSAWHVMTGPGEMSLLS